MRISADDATEYMLFGPGEHPAPEER